MRDTFLEIIATAEQADRLSRDIDTLLRSTDKPLDSELAAGLHRVSVVARDLALNAEEALISLSPRLKELVNS
jgi:hypothetical protein